MVVVGFPHRKKNYSETCFSSGSVLQLFRSMFLLHHEASSKWLRAAHAHPRPAVGPQCAACSGEAAGLLELKMCGSRNGRMKMFVYIWFKLFVIFGFVGQKINGKLFWTCFFYFGSLAVFGNVSRTF